MTFKIVHHTHPLLSQKLESFDFLDPPVDPIEFAKELFETMIESEAIGLAANQCGFPYRVFCIKSNPGIVCYNPRIVDSSTKEVLLDEGCVSYPKLFLKVKRPQTIKVRYDEPNGNTVTTKFTGITARVFLHEYDHLEGINFTRRSNRIHLDRALRQQKWLLRHTKHA
jgi:peptide deformylase